MQLQTDPLISLELSALRIRATTDKARNVLSWLEIDDLRTAEQLRQEGAG